MSFDTFLSDEVQRMDALITVRPADSRFDYETSKRIGSSPTPLEFYADSDRRKILSGGTAGVVNDGHARIHLPKLIPGELAKVTIFAYNPNRDWDARLTFPNTEKDGIEVQIGMIPAASVAPLTIAIRSQKPVRVALDYVVEWTPHGR